MWCKLKINGTAGGIDINTLNGKLSVTSIVVINAEQHRTAITFLREDFGSFFTDTPIR